eukprot:601963-Rhodomonas_salina.2
MLSSYAIILFYHPILSSYDIILCCRAMPRSRVMLLRYAPTRLLRRVRYGPALPQYWAVLLSFYAMCGTATAYAATRGTLSCYRRRICCYARFAMLLRVLSARIR